jgi:hypothetical protein
MTCSFEQLGYRPGAVRERFSHVDNSNDEPAARGFLPAGGSAILL